MKKILTAALAALTLGGAVAATATSAEARPYGGWHGGGGYYHGGGWHGGGWRGGGAGWALGAGLAGLAVGAALADQSYYGPGYYYGPPPAYGVCFAPRRVWDPYYGGWVVQNVRYPC